MFNFFKKKEPQPEIRDVLFGDLPISQWTGESDGSDSEPWSSFKLAGEYLDSGQAEEAAALLDGILAMPNLESRHYLQAWHFLREQGFEPEDAVAKELLGVVVEVHMPEGLDLVAAYADGTARYFNYSGAGVVWNAPDTSLQEDIQHLLDAGERIVGQIGPWEEPRPDAPPTGHARINILTPSGLHFGQGSISALADDPLGGIAIAMALQLMDSLITKTGN